MRCPNCNTPNGEAETRCRHCGEALFDLAERASSPWARPTDLWRYLVSVTQERLETDRRLLEQQVAEIVRGEP